MVVRTVPSDRIHLASPETGPRFVIRVRRSKAAA